MMNAQWIFPSNDFVWLREKLIFSACPTTSEIGIFAHQLSNSVLFKHWPCNFYFFNLIFILQHVSWLLSLCDCNILLGIILHISRSTFRNIILLFLQSSKVCTTPPNFFCLFFFVKVTFAPKMPPALLILPCDRACLVVFVWSLYKGYIHGSTIFPNSPFLQA